MPAEVHAGLVELELGQRAGARVADRAIEHEVASSGRPQEDRREHRLGVALGGRHPHQREGAARDGVDAGDAQAGRRHGALGHVADLLPQEHQERLGHRAREHADDLLGVAERLVALVDVAEEVVVVAGHHDAASYVATARTFLAPNLRRGSKGRPRGFGHRQSAVNFC